MQFISNKNGTTLSTALCTMLLKQLYLLALHGTMPKIHYFITLLPTIWHETDIDMVQIWFLLVDHTIRLTSYLRQLATHPKLKDDPDIFNFLQDIELAKQDIHFDMKKIIDDVVQKMIAIKIGKIMKMTRTFFSCSGIMSS